MEQVRKLTEKVTQQAGVVEQLQEKADDLERVKRYAGTEKVQGMIDSMKEMERLDREQKRLQRSDNRGISR